MFNKVKKWSYALVTNKIKKKNLTSDQTQTVTTDY